MKPTQLVTGILILGLAYVAQAQSAIHVSETIGNSPGSAFIPVPASFNRNNGPVPTYSLKARILFNPLLATTVSAQGLNGASCGVNHEESYVALEVDGGGYELATSNYCEIFVDGIVGGLPSFTELPLVPIDSAPNFSDGGCRGQMGQVVTCTVLPGSILINLTDLLLRSGFDG